MKIRQYLLVATFMGAVFTFTACNEGQPDNNSDINTTDSTNAQQKEEDAQSPPVKPDEMATTRAKIMAAVKVENLGKYDSLINTVATQQHYSEFNKQWAQLEAQRLSKIEPWRKKELADLSQEGRNLFYPFSGPDFLNAYLFFPNCDNYLMFGLEPNGKLVDLENMPPNYLSGLRSALAEIFERNYFITSYMSGKLWGKGVLPIINIFMARTNNQIVEMKRFYLDKDGKPTFFKLEDEKTGKGKLEGIMIEFLNVNKTKPQRVYYFGTDVQDDKMQSKMELVAFIKSFPQKITFIKSASYILHNTNFSVIRNIVLEDTDAILQDDTGVRYKVLAEKGWDITLYGKYARPVADFGAYTFQPALRDAYQTRNDIRPLDFTFGYHWKTDNTSLLLCKKPESE